MASSAYSSSKLQNVYILGAGFSKAISNAMPLTDELGNLCVERDEQFKRDAQGAEPFINGNFERWLSRRAEEQPYLSTAENLANRAVFARGTRLISEVLSERVGTALVGSMPSWLGELISIWHLQRAQVLTFNYDPFVECAFATLRFVDWRSGRQFQWGSLINYTPSGIAGSSFGEAGESAAPHDSFRLWKLHGSLNWFWAPGDVTGATIKRARLPGVFGESKPLTAQEQHWMAPGRESFIVPPTALKSGYYANPVTREIWQRAYEAVGSAETITLMGYSLPQTDLSTSGMLAEALSGSQRQRFVVVDRFPGSLGEPDSIVSRLERLARVDGHVEVFSDTENPIEEFVVKLLAKANNDFMTQFKAHQHGEHPLLIDWGPTNEHSVKQIGRAAAITGMTGPDDAGSLLLLAEGLDSVSVATRHPRNSPVMGITQVTSDAPLTVMQLRIALLEATGVTVVLPDGRRFTPIDIVERRFDSGHAGTWLQIVLAGNPDVSTP